MGRRGTHGKGGGTRLTEENSVYISKSQTQLSAGEHLNIFIFDDDNFISFI